MDNFITIRRRDDTAVPLLAPNQDIYLRENIRSRLLVAAQAVPRHQEETYRQALENVSTWVRAYYDTDDATTKAFLDEVDQLSQQNISMDLPETLQSQAMLEKLMQTRVRNLLAQPQQGQRKLNLHLHLHLHRKLMLRQPRRKENNHAKSVIALCVADCGDRGWPDDCRPSGLRADPDRQLQY